MDGPLPIIEGIVIQLQVDHLPSGAHPKPVWLWCSHVDATEADVDRCWQAFLRRFDIEHTFRLFKQTLGWTVPQLHNPHAADRWTWIMIAAHTQLRLSRPPVNGSRRLWEKPLPAHHLSPARVRREFHNTHAKTGSPAAAPKTLPARSGSPTRIQQQTPRRYMPRREDHHNRHRPRSTTATNSLKIKLRRPWCRGAAEARWRPSKTVRAAQRRCWPSWRSCRGTGPGQRPA